MSGENTGFAELRAHLSELELFDGVLGTLGWDEQTYMPKKAAALRGAQTALLSRVVHERRTDPRIEGWLAALDDGRELERACRRNLGRAFRREKKVSAELVERLAIAKSDGFQAWMTAKKSGDFQAFLPALTKLIELSRARAQAIDPSRHPYEVLLEEYDPGTTVASLRSMFERLRAGLVPLIEAIATRPALPPITGAFPRDAQLALAKDVAAALGYDFDAGRIDESEHPFSTGHGEGDVRITTHLLETDFLTALGSTIHETGHALYEQGLPHRHAGTTVREAASFGLHESQSRFWENYIGRSEAFARFVAPKVAERFGRPVAAGDIFRAQNRVSRDFIRVAADEVTYNLHIIVRFEIELGLFEGTIAPADVPAAWNERYQRYLGITPPNDTVGCLQDVHWSAGLFGYFPSYTLGNLYAASLGATMKREMPDLFDRVEQGDFAPILGWLRERIHDIGHLYEAPEIVERAVGRRDSVEDLLAYLWDRVGSLYGVTRPT